MRACQDLPSLLHTEYMYTTQPALANTPRSIQDTLTSQPELASNCLPELGNIFCLLSTQGHKNSGVATTFRRYAALLTLKARV